MAQSCAAMFSRLRWQRSEGAIRQKALALDISIGQALKCPVLNQTDLPDVG
jgi:hypothetical protein